jgi:hypothetical protein
MCRIDPLLGNDREINNEAKAVARQCPLGKNGGTVGMWSAPRLYHATDRVQLIELASIRRVRGWCEMAASLRVSEWSAVEYSGVK